MNASRSLGSRGYNIVEDLHLQKHGCENLKPCMSTVFAFKCDFSPFQPQINKWHEVVPDYLLQVNVTSRPPDCSTACTLLQNAMSGFHWSGKVALVTGANSGIGAAITRRLLNLGLIVVALDRNIDDIQVYSKHLTFALKLMNFTVSRSQSSVMWRRVGCIRLENYMASHPRRLIMIFAAMRTSNLTPRKSCAYNFVRVHVMKGYSSVHS